MDCPGFEEITLCGGGDNCTLDMTSPAKGYFFKTWTIHKTFW
jgi:hypothetical protein